MKLLILILALFALLTAPYAQESRREADKLFPFMQGMKWGYIDRAGKVVVKPQFDIANEFSEGLASVVTFHDEPAKEGSAKEGPGEGVIPGGVIPPSPKAVKYAPPKCAFIDATGSVVIRGEPGVDFMRSRFQEGLAPVSKYVAGKGNVSGYIDRTGRLVIPIRFLSAGLFQDGLAPACEDFRKCGYIDKSGEFAIPPVFMETYPFSEGLASVVAEGGRVGFIDRSGETVIDPQFDNREGLGFSEGLSAVAYSGSMKYGYIDRTGRLAIYTDFDMARQFSEGLAAVRVDYKWGFISAEGKFVIPPRFEEAGRFVDGLAPVQIGRWWGYIDRSGKVVIEPRFGGAYPFDGDIAFVIAEGGGRGYIDRAGKYVWQPTK